MHVALWLWIGSASAADVIVSDAQTYEVTALTYGANTPSYVGGKFLEANGDAMLKATGATHMRWPGGNWANMIIWNDDYSVCPYFSKYSNKNAGWTWQWKAAGAFARTQGIEVLWQVNAAVGLVCGPSVAAALAADFVTNATALGVDVNYIEVGNENYGKWEVPYPDNPKAVSPEAYAAVCTAVVKAVKAVRPGVTVGCVGDLVREGAANTPFLDWNEKVLAGAGMDMDFLIIHEYYTKVADGDTSVGNLLTYGCGSYERSTGLLSAGAGAECCWSKWGDASSCGNYPAGGSGGICNDGVSKCTSNTDCSGVTPTPTPGPPSPDPTPSPPAPPPAPTPPGANCGPRNIAAAVKDDVATHAPSRTSPLPIMITEYGMEQPFQAETWSVVGGLFAAKHLGDAMEAGIMGSTFFALVNSDKPDFGMFSADDKPIAYGPVYAFAIFTRVAPVGSSMLAATLDPQAPDVSVYAFSRPEEDHYGVVLVNAGSESKTISLSGPWGDSSDLSAWTHTFAAASSQVYTAQSFDFDGMKGPAHGGPFPFDTISPPQELFTGSITLSAASVTGVVIAPSSAPPPTPPPPPPPTPPVPVPMCCPTNTPCGSDGCDDPSSWCGASEDNCVNRCRGTWCPLQGVSLI